MFDFISPIQRKKMALDLNGKICPKCCKPFKTKQTVKQIASNIYMHKKCFLLLSGQKPKTKFELDIEKGEKELEKALEILRGLGAICTYDKQPYFKPGNKPKQLGFVVNITFKDKTCQAIVRNERNNQIYFKGKSVEDVLKKYEHMLVIVNRKDSLMVGTFSDLVLINISKDRCTFVLKTFDVLQSNLPTLFPVNVDLTLENKISLVQNKQYFACDLVQKKSKRVEQARLL